MDPDSTIRSSERREIPRYSQVCRALTKCRRRRLFGSHVRAFGYGARKNPRISAALAKTSLSGGETLHSKGLSGAAARSVAEQTSVSDERFVNPNRRVSVGARVPPDVAQAVRQLAARGNRSTSREIARAIEEHVTAHDNAFSLDDGGGASSASPPSAREQP
jgi:hypothetical protein